MKSPSEKFHGVWFLNFLRIASKKEEIMRRNEIKVIQKKWAQVCG